MNYEKYQSWRHNIPFGSLSEKVLKHDFMVVSWSLRFWDLWEGGFKEVSRSICVHLESHAVKTGLNLNWLEAQCRVNMVNRHWSRLPLLSEWQYAHTSFPNGWKIWLRYKCGPYLTLLVFVVVIPKEGLAAHAANHIAYIRKGCTPIHVFPVPYDYPCHQESGLPFGFNHTSTNVPLIMIIQDKICMVVFSWA